MQHCWGKTLLTRRKLALHCTESDCQPPAPIIVGAGCNLIIIVYVGLHSYVVIGVSFELHMLRHAYMILQHRPPWLVANNITNLQSLPQ